MAKNTHDFKPIEGKYVNLREVTIDDAAFILQLRTTGKAVKFLHKTENNLQKQIDYIKRYLTLDNEYYFIIEHKDGTPLGTVSIYNIHEDEFTSGRWCMVEHSLPEEVLESSILGWNYAFNVPIAGKPLIVNILRIVKEMIIGLIRINCKCRLIF